ncbi:MAG: hypothetical protein HYY40_01075 [Bacteroidetes bacterium]|nr:hypothetical protein [Bacteroidota bacterium]
MTTLQFEKVLLDYTKGLPKDLLFEILDFIQFVRKKNTSGNKPTTMDISLLSSAQTGHLEKEFKNYKKIYPRE